MSNLLKQVSSINAAYQHPALMPMVCSSFKPIAMDWSSKTLVLLVLLSKIAVRLFNNAYYLHQVIVFGSLYAKSFLRENIQKSLPPTDEQDKELAPLKGNP